MVMSPSLANKESRMSVLHTPLKIGALELKNRIIMAPLTRSRCLDDQRIPNDLMLEYYVQRAEAGMILTEATSISPMAVGYARTPGIWSREQVAGWKKITSAVHQKGGKILLQLWHVGRVSDPLFLKGELPVAPSAIRPAGHVSLVRPEKPFVTPRALETHEIPSIVEDYKKAAQNALEAGFDGVEIHAANGYLIEQFLYDSTNLREDQYGGSIADRSRFLLEVVDAVCSVWSAQKVGVHLSPRGDAHDMKDSQPKDLFKHIAQELNQRNIAFIFTREYIGQDSLTPIIRENFQGQLIMNEKFSKEAAEEMVSSFKTDAVSFGLAFIANPDLVKRFEIDAPLNTVDFETLYAEGPKGYTDYPLLKS